MNHIERLNRRFADALGRVNNEPRFAWKWAPDLVYQTRKHIGESWTECNWANRLGKVWVLTELRRPVGMIGESAVPITEADWWKAYRGTKPFRKLSPYVFSETALLPGVEPSEEKTAFYIASIGEQMEKSLARLTCEGYAECEADREANMQEFFDMADDWWPAGWGSKTGAHTPGTRGGAISFT